jgi:glucokinase
METFDSQKANGLEDMIAQMLAMHPASVAAASFGIACPVVGGTCRPTNLAWSVSEDRLKTRFGLQRVRLLNDLTATALAIPLLDGAEIEALGTTPIDKTQNMGLVAPGTGLGIALLIYEQGRYRPVASEGGHVDFAPTDTQEIALWEHLRQQFEHVSAERVLSGQGLVNIYNWRKSLGTPSASPQVEAAMAEKDPARVIAENAMDGKDPLCHAVMQRFCRIFGAVAGNLALTGMTTGGMFLGGGIPPKILPLLKTSDFMAAFTAKGRFADLLKSISVNVIRNDKAALLGAAQHALDLADT